MGVKHGNLVDDQVEKSGSPPAILGVISPGLPLNYIHWLSVTTLFLNIAWGMLPYLVSFDLK